MQGYIKLWRKITEWEWYKDSNTKSLFLHFLLSANYKDARWQGVVIRRGQLVTGLKSLSENTGISIQSIRTSIERLKSTGEIISTSTNKFRIITLVKYDDYQSDEERPTSNQQARNGHFLTFPKKSTSKSTNKKSDITTINIEENKSISNEPTGTSTINQQPTNNQLTTNNNNNNNKNIYMAKISKRLVDTFLEESGLKRPDGDYQKQNLFPAIQLAKYITEVLQDHGLPEPSEDQIVQYFRNLMESLNDFDRKNATSVIYFKNHFNRLTKNL